MMARYLLKGFESWFGAAYRKISLTLAQNKLHLHPEGDMARNKKNREQTIHV